MPAGYFAPATGLLWKMVAGYGLDPTRLFQACDIAPERIGDPDLRLPNKTADRLWALAAEQIDDPCFGLHAARHLHPSHLGALGYAWLASPSLRTALQRLTRYLRLLTDQREILLQESGDQLLVETRLEPGALAQPERAHVAMTVLMTMCRWNVGPELRPLAVSFHHDANPCAAEFDAFFGCSVEFASERNGIVLHLDDADRAVEPQRAHPATASWGVGN
ncbi:MAG: AraC family transcriptional regulator [Thiohalocapsa sp.]